MNHAQIKVLVTSSRTWEDVTLVYRALAICLRYAPPRAEVDKRILVIHGDCLSGGDAIAKKWAKLHAAASEDPHPADWDGPDGKGAGFARNEVMVGLKPDIALAFIQPCTKRGCPHGPDPHWSHGATHTAGLCDDRGIPCVRFHALSGGELLPADTVQKY